jgi:hypothetical protein
LHWHTVHTLVHTHHLPLIQVQVVQPAHGARTSFLQYAILFPWTTMQVQVLPISFKATGTMDIYPYRFGSNWCDVANAASLAQLPNSINGNSNYNMTDSGSTNIGGAIAPSGREFWSYGAAVTGTNCFYLNGTKSSIVFQLVNPSGWSSGSSFTYNIMIELLSSGAAKGTVYTNGFNTNF